MIPKSGSAAQGAAEGAAGSLAAGRLELQLADAKPVYTRGEAIAEANRCLYCHGAPCIEACPTGIDIPTFIRKISTENLEGSARAILSANLLGYSCARVCPVEVLCVGACVYNDWHRTPIAIGRLQRYAVETVLEDGRAVTLLSQAARNGKKVACVGAGPASLACAGYLALEGVSVTLFEQHRIAGGLNATGVAPYKMHVAGALEEVEFIRALGVDIREGVTVGGDVKGADLLRDFDAVFLGAGLGADSLLGVPGEAGPGVVGAVEWIQRMKLEPGFALRGVEHAFVVGGGNTAIDAARELAKLGVREVSMLYRRTAAEMSGYAHEMEIARREGVRLIERAVPRLFERDGSGRLTALVLEDGVRHVADLVVVAIGQNKLREVVSAFPDVTLNEQGRVVADAASGRTANPKVWVGGDALRGGELVVTAAQDAKRSARSICAALGVSVRPDAAMNAGHQ